MRRFLLAVPLLAACFRAGTSPSALPPVATIERTQSLLSALADDSMEGRRTATPGEARAARFIAARFREARLEPAGDDGYFQRLLMVQRTTTTRSANGEDRTRTGPQLVTRADLDTVPAERRLTSVNVVGMIRGADPQLASEIVVVGAHFDHVGIRPPVDGDSIANGADDARYNAVMGEELALPRMPSVPKYLRAMGRCPPSPPKAPPAFCD